MSPTHITDAMVEAVEHEIAMGHNAWDCVDPKEIVAAARAPVEAEVTRLRAALERIVNGIPACGSDGGMYVEHHDQDGNPIGIEHVDPLAVIQCIDGVAREALAGSALTHLLPPCPTRSSITSPPSRLSN